MFTSRQPYRFQFDVTDMCNAGCPMCARTLPMDHCRPNPDKVVNVALDLAVFERSFPQALCDQTDEVSFGGALGEPSVAPDILEIVDFLTTRGVRLTLSTNGSTHGAAWWRRHGEMMVRTDSCLQVHIDGLADTNPLYRVNTDYEVIVSNAEAYLSTGAEAEWRFVIFRHNQHQIPEAFRLSRDMGFARFRLIDTSRFWHGPKFHYVMPDGARRFLETPTVSGAHFKVLGDALIYEGGERADHEIDTIECATMALNRPYISAQGQVSACGWFAGGAEETTYFEQLGIDRSELNIRNRPLWDIVRNEPFVSHYRRDIEASVFATCQRKCRQRIRSWRYAY